MNCPHCPHCQFAPAKVKPDPFAVYPAAISSVSVVLALLHQSSRPTFYHCPNCGKEFSKRTFAAQLCRLLLITTLAALLGFVAWVWIKSLITP